MDNFEKDIANLCRILSVICFANFSFKMKYSRRKYCYENEFPSPDSPEASGENLFVAAFATKDCNELLRQFALSGSGAGLAPKKKIILIKDNLSFVFL